MIQFTSSATDLHLAFSTVANFSEGKAILHVGANVILVSPCQEGAIVQKLEAASVTGEGDLAVSPYFLERAANFLSPLTGRISLRVECGELLLSSESRRAASCCFLKACGPATETYSFDWTPDLSLQASGVKLRTALRQAVPPSVDLYPGVDGLTDAAAVLQACNSRIELFGSNSVLRSWTVIEAPGQDNLQPLLVPPGLIRRTLKLHDLWRGTVSISPEGFLGNCDCFLRWSPEELKRRTPIALPPPRHLWSEKALLSTWVKVSELLSVAKTLEKSGRPPACRVSWDSTSVTVLPLAEAGDFDNARSSGVRIGNVRPILAQTGSLVLPAVAFEILSRMLGASDCQLKATESHLLLGSPRGFLAIGALFDRRLAVAA